MNLRGPELKLPDLSRLRAKLSGGSGSGKGAGVKAPDFLADVYYDLRERRLLPLIALVVVAIVAAPFLLAKDSEAPQLPAPATGAVGGAVTPTADGARLTVVESTPGLRDYRKRLHGTPTDPFVQKYTGVPSTSKLKSTGEGGGESGASPSSGSEPSAGGEAPSSVEGGSPPEGSGGSPGSGGSGGNGSGGEPGNPQGSKGVRLFEFVFDVQISHEEPTADGTRKMSEPEVRRGVKTLGQLPGEKRPVVTVGGLNLHNGKVIFLVSDEVRSLDGDFKCLTRAPGGLCELLEIDPGFPLELAYGPEKIAYRIKVVKIGTRWTGRPGDQRSARGRFSGPALGPLPKP